MRTRTNGLSTTTLLLAALIGCLAPPVGAQDPATSQPAAGPAQSRTQAAKPAEQATSQATGAQPDAKGEKPSFKPEEIDQMLAPIALYPDTLLTQVLMASTYPLEIVQADRWAKAHKELKGDAAAKALEKEAWDPSVKSLVNFPDVLAMLSEKLDWTQKLGDAFIGQQKEVLDAVQKLRAKAKETGNLESNDKQKVSGSAPTIVIESTSPEVIYVPTTNTTVVYGAWPYPAYPPYPYYPPGYYYPSTGVAFGTGIAVGFAWGYAWGHCDWGHSDVDIDIDRNTTINNNIDRGKYKDRAGTNGGKGTWKHDGSHRQGVPYRDQASAKQYGGVSSRQATQAREQYRGRDGASQQPAARPSSGGGAKPNTVGTAAGAGVDRKPSTSGAAGANRTPSTTGTANRGGALDGVNGGGQSARASSSRGQASRGSAPARPSAGRSGGGSRGGGRGGGGRR